MKKVWTFSAFKSVLSVVNRGSLFITNYSAQLSTELLLCTAFHRPNSTRTSAYIFINSNFYSLHPCISESTCLQIVTILQDTLRIGQRPDFVSGLLQSYSIQNSNGLVKQCHAVFIRLAAYLNYFFTICLHLFILDRWHWLVARNESKDHQNMPLINGVF